MALLHLALHIGVAFVVISSVLMVRTSAESEGYSMFVSVDETKVSIESGNFTVVVTKEWPRVIFWHTTDILSPTFEVGFPRMYLFNDTDMNGMFTGPEVNLTVFMDSKHATWTFSRVEVSHSVDFGEYLEFSMNATVSAYSPTGEGPPEIEDFANITYYFVLTENPTLRENTLGTYLVEGKTELWMGMSIQITNDTDLPYLATEAFLQGGASTMLFNISGVNDSSESDGLVLSSRVDDRLVGENFTRPLNVTDGPQMTIDYAKDDGTARAFYAPCSVMSYELASATSNLTACCSCYTTGNGLVLHSVISLDNTTISVSHDGSLGIYEESFTGRIRDLVRENLAVFLGVFVGATVAVVAVSYMIVRRRRNRRIPPRSGESDRGGP